MDLEYDIPLTMGVLAPIVYAYSSALVYDSTTDWSDYHSYYSHLTAVRQNPDAIDCVPDDFMTQEIVNTLTH